MEIKGNVSGAMLVGVVLLIWGMFIVQISAQPAWTPTCYSKCMTKCTIPAKFKSCQAMCILKCARNGEQISTTSITNSVESNEDDTQHKYCVLGCACSKCINISTPTDPRADEVERCVNSCDETCIKN
ncbi:hypothetical protein MKX01_018832 [Papaver californicum]|nr:hypothetical protein MKX01_018832 [Papaver californicum]